MAVRRSSRAKQQSTTIGGIAVFAVLGLVAVVSVVGVVIGVNRGQRPPLSRADFSQDLTFDELDLIDQNRTTAQITESGVVTTPEIGGGTWKNLAGGTSPMVVSGTTQTESDVDFELGALNNPIVAWKAEDGSGNTSIRVSRWLSEVKEFRGIDNTTEPYDVIASSAVAIGNLFKPVIITRGATLGVLYGLQTLDPAPTMHLEFKRYNSDSDSWVGFFGEVDEIGNAADTIVPEDGTIDALGRMHVVYRSSEGAGAGTDVFYAYKASTSWNDLDGTDGFSTVDKIYLSSGIPASDVRISVAIDGDSHVPHVVWREDEAGFAYYSTFKPGASIWSGRYAGDALERVDDLSDFWENSGSGLPVELAMIGVNPVVLAHQNGANDNIRLIQLQDGAWKGKIAAAADLVDSGINGAIQAAHLAIRQDQPCVFWSNIDAYFTCFRDGGYHGLANTAEARDVFDSAAFGSAEAPAHARGFQVDSSGQPQIILCANVSGSGCDIFYSRFTAENGVWRSPSGNEFDHATTGRTASTTATNVLFDLSTVRIPHVVMLTSTGNSITHIRFGQNFATNGALYTLNLNTSGEIPQTVTVTCTECAENNGSIDLLVSGDGISYTPANFGSPVAVAEASVSENGITARTHDYVGIQLQLATSADGLTPEVDEVSISASTVAAPAPGQPSATFSYIRLSGETRVQTAVDVDQERFPTADSASAVMLCRSDFPIDCLGGSPLAAQMNAALLLNPTPALNTDVATEIQRVTTPDKPVILLGLQAALSDQVVADIQALGYTDVTRIGNTDRYGTAADITARLRSLSPAPLTRMFGASGETAIDALTASSPAGVPDANGSLTGILLVRKDSVPQSVADELAANTSLTEFDIFGGEAVVSASTASSLSALMPSLTTFRRIAGTGREATSKVAAETFFQHPGTLCLAAGRSPSGGLAVDPLSGGPLCSAAQAPILLTPKDAPVHAEIGAYLDSVRSYVQKLVILGGTAAITDAAVGDAIVHLGH